MARKQFVVPASQYDVTRRALDATLMMQEARSISGLDDFGDESFVAPLRKMMDCFARDINFHATGLKEFREEVVRDLVNRLRMHDDFRRHPEILDEDVSDPIMIIGLPRSGTTKMQRMIGIDPRLFKTFTWQFLNPAPFPNAVAGRPDPRIAAAFAGDLSLIDQEKAEVHAGHHMAADQIDEDWTLFEHTFNSWYQLNRQPSRSWHEWVMSRSDPSDLSNYRFVYSMVQYLQWQQGGRGNKRWLLKSCGHLAHMQELIAVFPKATIVHAHRHPKFSLPSLSKLLLDVWGLRVADLDPLFVGDFLFNWEKESMDRYLLTRDRLGLDKRILDVQYDQIRDDPIPVFRGIYRRAAIPMMAEAEQSMLQWERDNEQGKHGKHSYSLEQFGLSEKKINEAFGEYIHRFVEQ